MSAEEEVVPTCGKGLALFATLPAKLGELVASLAATLQNHTRSLSSDDTNARRELAVYTTLAKEQRQIAAALRETAERMAGSRDLPMAPHDEEVLGDPRSLSVFELFVNAEQVLFDHLQKTLARDRKMLEELRAAT